MILFVSEMQQSFDHLFRHNCNSEREDNSMPTNCNSKRKDNSMPINSNTERKQLKAF